MSQRTAALHQVLDVESPSLYHLSYDAKSNQLQLVMDRRLWQRLCRDGRFFPDGNFNINDFRECGIPGMWGIPGNMEAFDHPFGFGGLCRVSTVGSVTKLIIDFEQYKDDDGGGWLWNTYATLAVVAGAFWAIDAADYVSCLPPQMFTFEQRINPTEFMNGACCQANLCPPFRAWLASDKAPEWDHNHQNPIAESMRKVGETGARYKASDYGYNVTVRKVDKGSFNSDTFSVHFTVPGNACGLDSSRGMGENHQLSPHNVDHTRQAYALLVGVAELSDMALGIDDDLQWLRLSEENLKTVN